MFGVIERQAIIICMWCVSVCGRGRGREAARERKSTLSLCTLYRSAVTASDITVRSREEVIILERWCNVGFGEERDYREDQIAKSDSLQGALLTLIWTHFVVDQRLLHAVVMIADDGCACNLTNPKQRS